MVLTQFLGDGDRVPSTIGISYAGQIASNVAAAASAPVNQPQRASGGIEMLDPRPMQDLSRHGRARSRRLSRMVLLMQ